MPRLIAALIRHGDYQQLANTPSAFQPFPLNRGGEQQALDGAASLAADIARHGWELDPVIDCSRLLRAWQTADIIATALSAPLRLAEFDVLAERSVGIAGNLDIATIEKLLHDDPRYSSPPPAWKADSRYQLPFPGAESLLQAGQRVADHLIRRMQELPVADGGDRVKLFVGHGAAFRHAAFQLGVLEYAQIAELSMYHVRPVYLERLPDGRWRHVGGDWKRRRPAAGFND